MLPGRPGGNSPRRIPGSCVTRVDTVLGSGSGHLALLGPLRPARSSTGRRLRTAQWDPSAGLLRGKHRPRGCRGSSWSDLGLSPLGPHGLTRTLPPGPGSGIQSIPPFLRTAYLSCHLWISFVKSAKM